MTPPATQKAAPPDPFADIDPDIFDPSRLTDVFGEFGPEARAFLARFLGDAPAAAARVTTPLTAGDKDGAHHAAHALKGAAGSVGAVRLARLAGDVQDALEAKDAATAELLAGLLEPTVAELRAALAGLAEGKHA
ncbi:MAG: Hpt domain-containing protein [Tagaea sp.]